MEEENDDLDFLSPHVCGPAPQTPRQEARRREAVAKASRKTSHVRRHDDWFVCTNGTRKFCN